MPNLKALSLTTLITLTLTGCMSTDPKLGGSGGMTTTGGAGGSAASGANSQLEKCDTPLGTLSVFEDTDDNWWRDYQSRYPKLGSTLPVVRVMIQQSNCFVIVERGKAMAAMRAERELMNSGELRAGSDFGSGQMVSADYTVSPSIQFSEKGTQKAGGLIGGWVGLVAGGLSANEASTTLMLIDNRSGVQVSAATGSAKNYDFGGFAGIWGLGLGAGGYTDTPEGKVISASFLDSYNNMVRALRNYKAQQITGRKLMVQ